MPLATAEYRRHDLPVAGAECGTAVKEERDIAAEFEAAFREERSLEVMRRRVTELSSRTGKTVDELLAQNTEETAREIISASIHKEIK